MKVVWGPAIVTWVQVKIRLGGSPTTQVITAAFLYKISVKATHTHLRHYCQNSCSTSHCKKSPARVSLGNKSYNITLVSTDTATVPQT